LTIRPLIALLRIAPDDSLDREVSTTRIAMLDAALVALADQDGEAAAAVRAEYNSVRAASVDRSLPQRAYDHMRMLAIVAERRELIERRRLERIDDDTYHLLEEELDRAELNAEGPASSG
jgi:hypothetical protein